MIILNKDEHRLLRFWTREEMKEGIHLEVFDMDEGREKDEKFVLKYQESCKTFVFQNGWQEFVRKKQLNAGHKVEFRWNTRSSKILFKTSGQDPAPPGKDFIIS